MKKQLSKINKFLFTSILTSFSTLLLGQNNCCLDTLYDINNKPYKIIHCCANSSSFDTLYVDIDGKILHNVKYDKNKLIYKSLCREIIRQMTVPDNCITNKWYNGTLSLLIRKDGSLSIRITDGFKENQSKEILKNINVDINTFPLLLKYLQKQSPKYIEVSCSFGIIRKNGCGN